MLSRAKPFDLPVLLNAGSAREFLGTYWPNTLFVGHGPRARLSALLKVPGLKSGAAFLDAWKGTATAWPRLQAADSIETIQAGQMARMYREGFTLYFAKVEDELPAVTPLLRRIEKDLGLRRGDMTCEAILSRKGAGASAHFDADCTFNLQLEGSKRWLVERNTSVSYPHKAGMMGSPMHPGMAAYASAPFPSSMSADAQAFDTRAGSVTFLPHGCWHRTECLADSFAIAFVSPGPKWYQLFAGEVEAELVKFSEARRLSMVGPHASRESAAIVLDRLRAIVNGMEIEPLLKRWAGPPAFYFHRLTPRQGASLRRPPPELQPLARWVSKAPDVFSTFDAMDAFPRVESSAILRGLFTLVEAGMLELA